MSVTPSDLLTVGLLVILEGLLSADNAMVLAILVLGLPATSLRVLSSAANRLRQAGWKNFAQHGTYAVVLFLCYAIGDIHTARSLALCLVIARYASAAVSLQNLRDLRANRGFASSRTTSPWPPPWRPPSAV